MAEFKGMGDSPTPEIAQNEPLVMQPLFETFDPRTQGGLVTLSDGMVAEIKHPGWVVAGGSTEPEDRILCLPISYEVSENGEETFRWVSERGWNPKSPTQGSEMEIEVRHKGSQYKPTENGADLQYPNGSTEKLTAVGLDPEGFKQMVEFGTDVATGWEEHRANFITKSAYVEHWLEVHGFESPYLTVLPDVSNHDDVSGHPWVQLIATRMPSITEFNCLSMQLHVQLESVESGIHALTKYQAVQALFGLVTAAAPIRDGSFETTLAQHYHDGHRKVTADETVLPERDLINNGSYGDVTPYDWREFARVLGSQSAGAFAEAVPADLETFLRTGDRKLRDGTSVSVMRTFGWHTDRLRLDKGTVEICNLGTAGGNLHKSLAVQEAVSKFMVALQEEHRKGANAHNWQAQYEHAIEVGQANNYFAGLTGKETKLIGEDGTPVAPADMLASIKAFIDEHSPVPLSDRAYAELQATLEQAPDSSMFDTAEDVFTYFFEPGSHMTATDALRIAHEVEPDMPVGNLLSLYANVRCEHTFAKTAQFAWQRTLYGTAATVAIQQLTT